MATSDSSKSAQERREAQRETLRKQREAELKRQRSVRTVVIAVIVIVALVLVGGLGYLIYRSVKPAGPVTTPEGVAADQPYLELGAPSDSGAPLLELHVDFMCPYCGQFEQINGEDIGEMVANDEITLDLVPRRLLDSYSTTGDFSSRAANALVCVYEENEDNAYPFVQLMFANQPEEGSAGLNDDTIFSYAQEVGASDAVRSCMDARTYQPWVRQVVDPWAVDNGGGTPYVEVNGTKFENWGEAGALRAELLGSAASDAGGAADAANASDGGEG